MLSKAMEFQGDNLKVDPSSTALGRMASAEEVAPFILFLLGRKPVSSPELHIASMVDGTVKCSFAEERAYVLCYMTEFKVSLDSLGSSPLCVVCLWNC